MARLLGVAAADGVVTPVARGAGRRTLDDHEPLFPKVRAALLDASRALQSAVLLRTRPLSGKRLRAAERCLARALENADGDAARAAEIRLILALLAARDGRFDEALRRYGEVARNDTSNPRPQALAFILCGLTGQLGEMRRWEPGFRRLVMGAAGDHRDPLRRLVDELVAAAALGGAPYAIVEDEAQLLTTQMIMLCAADSADAGLAAAIRDKGTPLVRKLQLRAARAFLHARITSLRARMRYALKDIVGLAESKRGVGNDEAS